MVEGQWLPPTAHYGVEVRDTVGGPRMGSQLVAALRRQDGTAVLVDLGWLQDAAPLVLPVGEARVVGFVRMAERPGWLSARDDPATRRFYTLDPQAIGQALGIEVAPFTVVALQTGDGKAGLPGDGAPVAATELPRPLNNHLSYAVTWFGLAVTLLVVFAVWVRQQLRS